MWDTIWGFVLGSLTTTTFILVVMWIALFRKYSEESAVARSKAMLTRVPWSQAAIDDAAAKARPLLNEPVTRKGWFRIQDHYSEDTDETASDPTGWNYCVLHSNILIIYTKEQDAIAGSAPRGVINLDDVHVETVPVDLGTVRRFVRKFPLRLTSLKGEKICGMIFPTSPVAYMHARTGREKEEWFYVLQRGSRLNNKDYLQKDQIFTSKRAERFGALADAIGKQNEFVSADWFNALLGRMFWNYYDNPGFLGIVRAKIEKKLARVKKPAAVTEIALRDLGMGPNVPIITRARLVSVDKDGVVEVEAFFTYDGGLRFTLEPKITFTMPLLNNTVEFPFMLTLGFKKMSGHILLRMAAPPTDRVWVGFFEKPDLEMTVETAFGKGLTINLPEIADIIVDKLKGELVDVLLLPHMDDTQLPNLAPLGAGAPPESPVASSAPTTSFPASAGSATTATTTAAAVPASTSGSGLNRTTPAAREAAAAAAAGAVVGAGVGAVAATAATSANRPTVAPTLTAAGTTIAAKPTASSSSGGPVVLPAGPVVPSTGELPGGPAVAPPSAPVPIPAASTAAPAASSADMMDFDMIKSRLAKRGAAAKAGTTVEPAAKPAAATTAAPTVVEPSTSPPAAKKNEFELLKERTKKLTSTVTGKVGDVKDLGKAGIQKGLAKLGIRRRSTDASAVSDEDGAGAEESTGASASVQPLPEVTEVPSPAPESATAPQ